MGVLLDAFRYEARGTLSRAFSGGFRLKKPPTSPAMNASDLVPFFGDHLFRFVAWRFLLTFTRFCVTNNPV